MRVEGGSAREWTPEDEPKLSEGPSSAKTVAQPFQAEERPLSERGAQRLYTLRTRQISKMFLDAVGEAKKGPTPSANAAVSALFEQIKPMMEAEGVSIKQLTSDTYLDLQGRIHTIGERLGTGGIKEVHQGQIAGLCHETFQAVEHANPRAYASVKPGKALSTKAVEVMRTLNEGKARGLPGSQHLLPGEYHAIETESGEKGQLILLDQCNGDLVDFWSAGYIWDNSELQAHALSVAEQIAACHKMDIVHRDLSLDNVLVQVVEDPTTGEPTPVMRLTDFDLAGSASETYGVVGKPGNIAPEVINGTMEETPNGRKQADVYSFGVMLARLYHPNPFVHGPLFQYPPNWDGKAQFTPDKVTELFSHQLSNVTESGEPPEVIPSPSWMASVFPDGIPFLPNRNNPNHVDHLIARMLHQDPNKRPTQQEVVEFLKYPNLEMPPNFFDDDEDGGV